MDRLQGNKLTYEFAPSNFLTAKAPEHKEGKVRESRGDEVTISTPSKTSKSSHKKAASHKKEAKHSEKAERKEHTKASAALTCIHQDDEMPVMGHRGHSGPDDIDDNGACPGGVRHDNEDNPDSVSDGGGCSIGSGDGGYNIVGPDGGYTYDEFH
jgi:hypothetical protein